MKAEKMRERRAEMGEWAEELDDKQLKRSWRVSHRRETIS